MKWLTALIFCFLLVVPSHAGVLLQKNNMEYLGAFRLPKGNLGGESPLNDTLAGGGILAYNQANNSLFVTGKKAGSGSTVYTVEISIPSLSTSTTITSLNTASVLQVPIDLSGGQYGYLKADRTYIENGGRPGGLMVYNNRIIGTSFAYYDAAYEAEYSHFAAGLDWTGQAKSYTTIQRVGNPLYGTVAGGFVGGYMTKIPTEWQAALGGPALTGKGALAIIARTSLGPCAYVFDPDRVGVDSPSAATPVLGYPYDHPVIGTYAGPSLLYNMGARVTGVAFPSGADSVLFFGRMGHGADGLGTGCYGPGTTNIEEAGRTAKSPDPTCGDYTVTGTKTCCYDPTFPDATDHAYPYKSMVWAYRAQDLADVKSGSKSTWEITPYATWDVDEDLRWSGSDGNNLISTAFDDVNKILYFTTFGEVVGFETYPVVHAFRVNIPVGQRYKISGIVKTP